jgi:hypothetical protein
MKKLFYNIDAELNTELKESRSYKLFYCVKFKSKFSVYLSKLQYFQLIVIFQSIMFIQSGKFIFLNYWIANSIEFSKFVCHRQYFHYLSYSLSPVRLLLLTATFTLVYYLKTRIVVTLCIALIKNS